MKRIICMAVCLALIATMAISGSVAYLYDQDDDVNVFAVGNVDIVQYEEERTDSTESGLDDFTQGQMKYPMVESGEEKNPTKDIHGNNVTLRDLSHYRNYVDKIVSVENKGDSEAFVRNIVAIPTGLDAGAEDVDWLEVDWFDFGTKSSTEWTLVEPITEDVEIDGVLYDLYVFNYSNSVDGGKLQPADFTAPTLLGFGLSQNVGYDDVQGRYYYEEEFNSSDRTYININPQEMKIYVATQAVQTHGFDDFEHAFKETFGTIGKKNHPWYEGPIIPTESVVVEGEQTKKLAWSELVTEGYVRLNNYNQLNYISPKVKTLVVDGSVTNTHIAGRNNSDLILETVVLGEGVNHIDDSVFRGVSTLKTVILPSNDIVLDNNAFQNCTSLEEFTISNNVTLNGYNIFKGCTGLKTVTIGNQIAVIPNNTFEGCTALASIEIPDSVKKIGTKAFYGCSSLQKVSIPAGTIFENTSYPTNGVESIFENCTALEEVTFGEGMTSVPYKCFMYCTSLKKAVLPESATTIGNYAFYNCTSLEYIKYNQSAVKDSFTFGGVPNTCVREFYS